MIGTLLLFARRAGAIAWKKGLPQMSLAVRELSHLAGQACSLILSLAAVKSTLDASPSPVAAKQLNSVDGIDQM